MIAFVGGVERVAEPFEGAQVDSDLSRLYYDILGKGNQAHSAVPDAFQIRAVVTTRLP